MFAFQRQGAIDASVYELLAAPGRFDGRAVRVIGVAGFSFMHNGISGVYATPDDFRHNTQALIEIAGFEPGVLAQEQALMRLNGKYVLVEGVFQARPAPPRQPTEGETLICVGRCWGSGFLNAVNRVSPWQY